MSARAHTHEHVRKHVPGLLTAKTRAILKEIFAVGSAMYPEAMATMYCINTPFAFRAVRVSE